MKAPLVGAFIYSSSSFLV